MKKLKYIISILIVLIFLPSVGRCSNGWEIQYPDVRTNWLNDIWASADNNVFVVGFNMDGATIGHYDGQTWKNMNPHIMGQPLSELMAIWGSSANDIFAVGGTTTGIDGTAIILHYDGSAWSVVSSDWPGCLFSVWGSGPNNVFAVGMEGLILHWDGNSWTQMSLEALPSLPDLQGLWGDGPNNVWAVGKDTILHYQNGQWSLMPNVPLSYLYDIYGAPGGDTWAVGDHILRYNGSVWQDVTPSDLPENFCFYKIRGRSANDIMAVGVAGLNENVGVVIRYNGQEWKVENVSPPGYLLSAWLDQDNKAIVVGGNFLYDSYSQEISLFQGIILSYQQASWSGGSEDSYLGDCYQTWARGKADVFAVGGHPSPPTDDLAKVFIAHYDGSTWSRVKVDENGILYDIWGSSSELFAVGGDEYETDDGQTIGRAMILHSSNGQDWINIPDSLDFEDVLYGVWGTSANNVFAVGDNIYHFDGTHCSKMESPTTYGLNDIWGSDPNHVWAVGQADSDNKAAILFYNGQSWASMNHNIEGDLFKIWGTSPDDIFVLGDKIYHYDGHTWSVMDCPLSDVQFYDIWGTSSNNVFVLYEVGDPFDSQCGLLHYDGTEWTDKGLAPTTAALWGIGGSSELFIAGNYGTILHYKDEESIQQKIPLWKGWNLLSFQVNVCFHSQQQPPQVFFPDGIEFRQVGDLADWLSDNNNSPLRDETDPQQAGDWERVVSFDQRAHMLGRYVPSSVNSMEYISAGYGYWIKMNKPGYLILNGQVIPGSTSLPLHKGWNLVGTISPDSCYYQGSDLPSDLPELPLINYIPISDSVVPIVFSSIAGQYDGIISFDHSGGKMYNPDLPESVCTLRYVSPGRGYWIKMNKEGDLAFPLP